MKNRDPYYIVAIIMLLIALGFMKQCGNDKVELFQIQQQILSDSLKVTVNAAGQQTAQIGLIQADFNQLKQLRFAELDSLGKQLQKLATRRTISATIATQQVKIDTVLKTDSVLYASDGCDSVFKLNDTTAYRTLNIEARRDSFHVSMRLFEKLTFTQEWSKWKPFQKQSCISSYKNDNPEVEITGLRTFTVKCDCGKKGWLAFAGGNITGGVLGFFGGYATAKLK